MQQTTSTYAVALLKESLALALLMTLGMTSNVFAAGKHNPLDTMPAGMSAAEQAQYKKWAAEQKDLHAKAEANKDQAAEKRKQEGQERRKKGQGW